MLRLTREGKVILVHADYITVAGPSDEIDKLLLVLNEEIATSDLGEPS